MYGIFPSEDLLLVLAVAFQEGSFFLLEYELNLQEWKLGFDFLAFHHV